MIAPASLNILFITPNTKPSLLLSKASDVIELENPVIGIIDPAPENWPILSYTPTQSFMQSRAA